jgi:hypothetical protein
VVSEQSATARSKGGGVVSEQSATDFEITSSKSMTVTFGICRIASNVPPEPPPVSFLFFSSLALLAPLAVKPFFCLPVLAVVSAII